MSGTWPALMSGTWPGFTGHVPDIRILTLLMSGTWPGMSGTWPVMSGMWPVMSVIWPVIDRRDNLWELTWFLGPLISNKIIQIPALSPFVHSHLNNRHQDYLTLLSYYMH